MKQTSKSLLFCSLLVFITILGATTVHGEVSINSDTPTLPFIENGDTSPERALGQQAFQPGEKIVFRVTYLGITAGYITVTVQEEKVRHRPLYQIKMTAKTVGVADWLYHIRSEAKSYMDAIGLYSWGFDYALKTDSDRETDVTRYYQSEGFWILNNSKKKKMPPYTQDVLSAMYYLRTLDLEVGQVYKFPVHVGDKNYISVIRVDKTEKIAVKDGWKEAFRLTPSVESDTKLKNAREHVKDQSEVHLWLSKGPKKIPLRISLPAVFGNMWGYLDEYKPK